MESASESLTALPDEPQAPPDLDSTELYANRELSWLDFNERVLQLAEDPETPLMERVKFLAIYTLQPRRVHRWCAWPACTTRWTPASTPARPTASRPRETIERIGERTRELGARQSRQWEDEVRPALAEHGIRVLGCDELLRGGARARRPALPRADLPGAHARWPSGPGRPVPLHLEPVAEHRASGCATR